MPNPLSVPLIGQNFSDLAQQRFGWANFNRGVEEANLSRAAAAEQNYNNYLGTVAAMRDRATQQDLQLQLSADAAAREDAWRKQQAAQHASEFAQNLAASKEALQVSKQAEEHRTAAMEYVADLRDRQAREQAQQNIELTGQTAAQNYASLKRQAEGAQQRLTEWEDELARLKERQTALQTGAAKTKWLGLKSVGMTEEEKVEFGQNEARIKQLDLLLSPKSQAVKDAEKAKNYFEKFREQFLGTDFTLDEEGGAIRHKTGKSWGFTPITGATTTTTTARNPLTAAMLMGPATTLDMASAMSKAMPTFRGRGAGASWEEAQPPSETASTGRVGRYSYEVAQ